MSLTDDDKTPNPEATATLAEVVALFQSFKREMRTELRELRKDLSQHVEISFSPLEDRVDAHDHDLAGLKTLLVSHQTSTSMALKSIQGGITELLAEARAIRGKA